MTSGESRSVVPGLLVAAGAGCLSVSAMFVKLAGVDAATTAFLRCALALVALVPVALVELRRHGRLDLRLVLCAVGAGLLLGTDYVMWSASIFAVGAGIATVLVNVQVLAFPVLALLFSGVPISRRFVLVSPVMLGGVALAGGVVGGHPASGDPLVGTLLGVAAGVAYAGYLYLNTLSGRRSPRHLITPVAIATAAACLASGLIGVLGLGGTHIDLVLPMRAWLWLVVLALLGQVIAWVLVAAGSGRLAPNVTAALLLLQPVLAIIIGMLFLREAPTTVQLLGCAVVIASVWYTSRRARSFRLGDHPQVTERVA
ncbi:DMT family transporter [Pseudonocardia spinosispora]|uniref:DMT family transporter n=1 Tax=Pseudonocardia spinosispora TaxID=103441 RepID=UPI000684B0DB|nr:DMT family transporter [Pseudonocardia spinosispora]